MNESESTERCAFCGDPAIGTTRAGRNACREHLREDRDRARDD